MNIKNLNDSLKWYLKNEQGQREYLINEYYPSILEQLDRSNFTDDFLYRLLNVHLKSLETLDWTLKEYGDNDESRALFFNAYKNMYRKFLKSVRSELS